MPYPALFPFQPKVFCDPETEIAVLTYGSQIRGWACIFLLGELFGSEGEVLKRWALEELTAWGKSVNRKEDNAFIPMFTDGSLEGYVLKKDGYFGARGTVYEAWHPQGVEFWGYALAYRLTGNEFIWEITQSIANGNELGDIGDIVNGESKFQKDTDSPYPYALLGFLELYRKTKRVEFLKMASRIGDNILTKRFHKGFFVASGKHIYTRFDSVEHLALLRLFAAIDSKSDSVPWVWPNASFFGWNYRQQLGVWDIEILYNLTESHEPPISLHEAAAVGDLEQVKSLILGGAKVNLRERAMWIPLHRAVTNGQRDIVKFLLTNGADVNVRNSWPGGTPLHYAAEKGHEEIAGLLIDYGADVNAESAFDDRATPLQYAAFTDRKDIIKLLLEKGAVIYNIQLAAYMGDLAKLDDFIQEGVDINALDTHGYTPLHYAAQNGQKETAKLLIAKGADVNVKSWSEQTPLGTAVRGIHKDIIELLISHGADIDAKDKSGRIALYIAVMGGRNDVAELLISKGADVNNSNSNGQTPLHLSASQG